MPPKNHKKKVYYIYIIKNLFYSSLQKIILIEIRNCEIHLTLIGSFLGLKQAFRDPCVTGRQFRKGFGRIRKKSREYLTTASAGWYLCPRKKKTTYHRP